MRETWVDNGPTKLRIGIAGAVLFLAALAIAIAVPSVKASYFGETLYTYYNQAQMTATPAEYAAVMRSKPYGKLVCIQETRRLLKGRILM